MTARTRDECLAAAAAVIFRAKLRMAEEDIAAEADEARAAA